MLHNQRRHAAERARREAEGESFWTTDFPDAARVQLIHFLRGQGNHGRLVTAAARNLILLDEGWMTLTRQGGSPVQDFEAFMTRCEHDLMPTAVEAWAQAADHTYTEGENFDYNVYRASDVVEPFRSFVNSVLLRHRIAFELIDGQMVEIESREMHAEVVAPLLRLLARSDGKWSAVESAYRGALDELTRGGAADAITDAGTALQEALEAAGATGNALGPLIRSARQQGILAAHDNPLADSVVRAADWVSADRSQTGDAHHVSGASLDDAWLTVHVVGALILRLSKGERRG